MWRNISTTLSSSQTSRTTRSTLIRKTSSNIARSTIFSSRSHRILEGTLHRIMLTITNSTLDLLVLQLLLDTSRLRLLLFRILFPIRARSEDDVLTYWGGICCWSCRVFLWKPKFCPWFTFCDTRVDNFFDGGEADAAGCLYFLAVVIEAPWNDGFGAIFVGGCGGRREFVGDFVEVLVVGPVWAAVAKLSEG